MIFKLINLLEKKFKQLWLLISIILDVADL